MALNDSGKLYSWGSNDFNQLGRALEDNDSEEQNKFGIITIDNCEKPKKVKKK